MEKELQGKLVEILSSIQAATGKASDFAMEQLPDIAQSYVVYGRVYMTAIIVFAVVFALFLCWMGSRFSKESGGMSWLASGFASVVPFVILLTTISDMFLVWFAPKVWLLKELAQLVK